MESRAILQIIGKKWQFILAVVVVVTVASFTLTIIQTPEYKTSAQLLVIQENRADMDSYTAAKSAEQITNTFAKVIYTGSFMERIFNGGYNVKDDFGVTPEKKMDNWEEAINVSTVPDTGFLKVDVYRSDRGQSWLLATAITDILTKNNSDYHGGGDKIQVSIVDPPTISDEIARPKIWQNTIIGAALGLAAAIILVVSFKNELSFDVLEKINEKTPEVSNIFENDKGRQETEFELPDVGSGDPESADLPDNTTGGGAPPASLPIAGLAGQGGNDNVDTEPAEPQAISEGEKVEITPEEKARHWLETGQLKK